MYTGSLDVAEEASQEALIRLWQHIDSVDDPRAWAFRCGLDEATSRFRRRRRDVGLLERLAAQPRNEGGSLDDESRLDVQRALRELPDRQRQAILLRYLGDLDLDGVAAAMGCAVGTVKSHLARGLDALRSNPTLESPSLAAKQTLEGVS